MNFTSASKMLSFLAIDFVIVVASWYIPADATSLRAIAASIQLLFLAITATQTAKFMVEDF